MADLPASGYFSDGARTNAEMKAALEAQRDVIFEMLGGSAQTELTIAAGSVTPTAAAHTIDTEGDAASDDLTHLVYDNHPEGRLLLIRAEDAARTVVVSPCTTTQSGRWSRRMSRMPASTAAVMSVRSWPAFMRSRSKSGVISKSRSTWSSISRCCAVTQTSTAIPSLRRSAPASGAILMASGRVPNTRRIDFPDFREALMRPRSADRAAMPQRRPRRS